MQHVNLKVIEKSIKINKSIKKQSVSIAFWYMQLSATQPGAAR